MYKVVVDGAARGQGAPVTVCSSCGSQSDIHRGEGAIGIAIYRHDKLISHVYRTLGKRTNNEAEYEAVIHALLICWAADLADPIIYSDSLVVVNQINGIWRCKAVELRPLLHTIEEIREHFRFRLVHVTRKAKTGINTTEADFLANRVLDLLEAKIRAEAPELE